MNGIPTFLRLEYVTTITKRVLDLGVQIRHVKNILPINFAIGGKEEEEEVHATIEYTEGGNLVKSLLVSNEPAYIKHFSSIFEELWKNSLIL